MLSIAAEAAPSPAPPPSRLYLHSGHPSIHPSTHPSIKRANKHKKRKQLHIHQALYHAPISHCMCLLQILSTGEALRPPPHPLLPVFLHSVHAPIYATIAECQPTDQPAKQRSGQTNKPSNQPSNQQTKQPNHITRVCAAGGAPSPAPPPASFCRASMHPSNKQTNRNSCTSITHCFTQSINTKLANQPTQLPKEGG